MLRPTPGKCPDLPNINLENQQETKPKRTNVMNFTYPNRPKHGAYRPKQIMRVMKLCIILMTTLLMQVSAITKAQINLTEKNASMEKVIKVLKKQSGYDFFYNGFNLKKAKPVTVNLHDASLEEALKVCFTGQDLTYTIDEKTIVISEKTPSILDKTKDALLGVFQNHIDVHGRVVDDQNNPLVGASVTLKGTTRAVITGSNGVFTLSNVDEKAVLIISYLGFEVKEIAVKPELGTIRLIQSLGKLNEVVVSTGYQTLPKERATGSFTTVNKELYNQQVGPDVLSRLEYIANGVSVFRNNNTKTSNFMVRGISTISGPTSPLIVVDNFPYDGDINNLNPNDVESVTVLKDAAAASIWGTKAGNGVIVITTKKGKYNQPLRIEANSSVTIGDKPDLDYLTPMSAADYIGFERNLYSKGYYNSQITSTKYPALSPVIQLLVKAANGSLTAAQADQQISALQNNDVRDDFSWYIYQKAVNQQYHIDLSGGDDKLAYLFSTGYDKDISSLAAAYDKLNLRSQASFSPLKGMQLTAGLAYTNSNNHTGKPAYGSNGFQQPYQMLADAAGNALPAVQTYGQAFKDNAAKTGQLLDWNYYPLTDYEHNYTITNTQDVLANFGVSYQIIKGLNVDVKYQYEKQQTDANTTYDSQSYFARNLINSYTQVSGSTLTYPVPKGGILDLQNTNLTSNNVRGQLNYSRDWEKHSISLIAGEEIREIANKTNKARDYGYDNTILTTSQVNYTTTYPNYVTKSSAAVPYNNSLSQTLTRFVSFYANGAYTYDGKYTISGSMRRDASNVFGVETNDKWTPLWSTGISWDIAKESFYHIDAVPYLKLRATYGFSGNVDPGKSAVTTIFYNTAVSIYTNTKIAAVENFFNPDLRWERVGTTNIGLDFRSKSNRLYGSIDYYHKNSTDLYATIPVDYTVGLGIATITKNAASMQGNGLDLEITSLNTNAAVKWLTSFNLGYYRDKVTKYYATATTGSNYVGGATLSPVQGTSVWGIYSYKWAGLDATGNPQGYMNGQVSEDYSSLTGSGSQISDLVYNGPRFPVFYGTLGNTVSYKALSLTVRLAYNFGNYFKRQALSYTSLATSNLINGNDYARRWQKPGDEGTTDVPSFVYPLVSGRDNFYYGSSTLVEKADCIRLQYVTLSYSLTRQQYHRLPFNSLQIYLNANNLGIIWRANKLGIDPNYYYTNSVMPIPASLALGLRVNF